MILVDTSVWVDHIRASNAALIDLLEQKLVLSHPFVIGELAVGNLPRRTIWLQSLTELPSAKVASHLEVMAMIERLKLFGRGIGYADIHLLASAQLSQCRLFTYDKRLASIAHELGTN